MKHYTKFVYNAKTSDLKTDFPSYCNGLYGNKIKAQEELNAKLKRLSDLQDKFFAHKKHSVLIILQGMDASGKDGIIKHVLSGINPQGLNITSFSTPTREEFAHDFLWRCSKSLPERGHIAVFNRSYYEEVLITRVHPDFLEKQHLPNIPKTPAEFDAFWKTRLSDISNYEKYLSNNGTLVLKFFLHISKDEQKKRFLKRIDRSTKNWKFQADDLSERAYWDDYMEYYNQTMEATSKNYARWYVLPADNKIYSRHLICDILIDKLEKLDISYPKVSYTQKRAIIDGKNHLLNEDDSDYVFENPSI